MDDKGQYDGGRRDTLGRHRDGPGYGDDYIKQRNTHTHTL